MRIFLNRSQVGMLIKKNCLTLYVLRLKKKSQWEKNPLYSIELVLHYIDQLPRFISPQ